MASDTMWGGLPFIVPSGTAMKYLYEEFNVKAEPSGCVSLAAVLSGKLSCEGKNILITILTE